MSCLRRNDLNRLSYGQTRKKTRRMNQTEPTRTGVPARRYHSRRISCGRCVCICSRAARFWRSTRRKTSTRQCSTSGKGHFSRSMRLSLPSGRLPTPSRGAHRSASRSLATLVGNCLRKFRRWQDCYGKVSRHNAKIPCDHWIERHEPAAIIEFARSYSLEGYHSLH